eukprot:15467843-Alexandrium_andersonii.AAC.1
MSGKRSGATPNCTLELLGPFPCGWAAHAGTALSCLSQSSCRQLPAALGRKRLWLPPSCGCSCPLGCAQSLH